MIDVGTEISCPDCKRVMVRCTKKPIVGTHGWGDCFESVEWDGKVGDPAVCACGGKFHHSTLGPWVEGIGYTW